MFFRGTFSATAGNITITNLFNDFVGLLTGTITSSAGLSVAWASSTFTNTTAPGWTLYDSAAGTIASGVTPCVLRAAWSDDATKYKNVYIYAISATQLAFIGYETWDSATHTGTNPVVASPTASTAYCLDVTAANLTSTKLILGAASTYFYLQHQSSATPPVPKASIGISEFSRDDPWNTVANGYPSWLQIGEFNVPAASAATQPAAQVLVPRIFNPTSGSDIVSFSLSGQSATTQYAAIAPNGIILGGQTGGSTFNAATGWGVFGAWQISATTAGSNGFVGGASTRAPARFIYSASLRTFPTTGTAFNFLGGSLTTVTNNAFYMTQYGQGNVGDTMTIGSDSYYLTGPASMGSTVSSSVNSRYCIKIS